MQEAVRTCHRCGREERPEASVCGWCGTRATPNGACIDDASSLTFLDTIHLPGTSAADPPESCVRPVLAVLFRVAVGPAADYYAPRFLAYEHAGRGAAGWNWPSFLFPSFWAFYRKLWLAGLAFAALPVAGALALAAIGPRIDAVRLPWLGSAVLLIWVLPGIISALVANSLLYHRVRRMVARAEASTPSAAQVASLLAVRNPTSLAAALLLGGSAIVLALLFAGPSVRGAWFEHDVRTKIAAGLDALRPLQEQVEENWDRFRAIPRALDYDGMRVRAATAFFDEVRFRPANGRLRLGLGSAIPELWGRTILLAPAVDPTQRIHWLCIPIDIPAQFLPGECRNP